MNDGYNNYDVTDDDSFVDDAVHQRSLYDRWRPALVAFAVLLSVVAFGVLSNDNSDSVEVASPDSIEQPTTTVQLVPLTRTLKTGMKGDDVLRLQQRLAAMRFDPGPQDGEFGQNTLQAVWAFKKLVMQTPRERTTGEVTPSTWVIMQQAAQVQPRRQADSPSHVDVHLPEQVLIVFKGGEVQLITHMSSGSNEAWCE